MNLLNKSLRML